MFNEYDYMVLCTDKDCFMMKSECEELGLNYIDLFSDLVEDFDYDFAQLKRFPLNMLQKKY